MVARPTRPARQLHVLTLDRIAQRLLATHTSWTVHSVFARAANLRSSAGDLLGLVLAPAPNGPATVILAEDAGLGPLSGWLEVGEVVQLSLSGRVSRLSPSPSPPGPLSRRGDPAQRRGPVREGKRERGGLVVRVQRARIWEPSPIVRRLDNGTVLRRVDQAAHAGMEESVEGGLAALLDEHLPPRTALPLPQAGEGAGGWGVASQTRSRTALAAINQGWQASDLDAFAEGCRQLSGLGPGLTPSGDDVLTGLALGVRAALGALPDAAGSAIRAATTGRTTDIAIARVQHAVDGHADEYVDGVLRALVMDADADLEGAVRRLLGYGHTSGADTLVGLLAGVRLGLAGAPDWW